MSVARIRRNDYGVLTPPALGAWTPELTVTVVIPAHDRQETLDLTLAALAAQSYPADLLDVIVVDDGSAPPLRLPDLCPAATRLLPSAPGGWGRAWALQTGIDAASGEVVLVLDADMVPHRGHVEAQLRWHHLAPYLVVLGWIDFTADAVLPAPAEVREALEAGNEEKLFHLSPLRHDWAEKIIEEHDGLRTAPNALAARVHVGATASYPAALLRRIGGLDTSLVLAEDTELGYRLAQAGAVFVPDPDARAWHLGLPTAMRDWAALKRYNDPFVADRVPNRRYLRVNQGRRWLVPYVDCVVEGEHAYEDVRATVDGLLAASLPDVRVTVTGPWRDLGSGRRHPLRDPDLDLRLIHATFEHDPRVRLTPPSAPPPGAVAPYRLRVPPGWMPGHDTLQRLTEHLDEHDLGALCVALAEEGDGVVVARLERTAALARAALLTRPDEHLDDVIHEVFGVEWVDGESWGFVRRPKVYPPRRRPLTELEQQALQHEKEITRLRRRAAALQAEMSQLRREAGKAERDAVRWRDKAEAWRQEAVRLTRAKERTVLKRAVRRVRDLTFPDQ
ncbi:glycosyltransferase [Nonomuraea endophytica]|uniref:Glycosyltransferase involved in cell wall biosynthesis n=1 Tax=Nonomuraea endophytica TaxID=714136 RepID=A0A7W8A5L3_9ACTN|nr:glycosyltransferase [Nonomuraea endophytica]MBB5079964.1 glycosyltransferase involved in cell wall biosynthesis [Nonomuraea endophytica]